MGIEAAMMFEERVVGLRSIKKQTTRLIEMTL
jgi:hypothetical protein